MRKKTTILTEYAPALGMKFLKDEDKKNRTAYYWSPEMGLCIAENAIGDIGIVYKAKAPLSEDIDEALSFIESHSEDGQVSITVFCTIEGARAFVHDFFMRLTRQQEWQ